MHMQVILSADLHRGGTLTRSLQNPFPHSDLATES